MNFQLVSSLLRSPWLIPQDIAETYYPALSMMLSGTPVEFDFDKFQIIAHIEGTSPKSSSESADFASGGQFTPGTVLEIPVKGPLMKNDQMCGPVGMKSIGNIIQQADKNPDIKGIVLNIDSPGGQAQGTPQLANIIRETKKPVVAYVDGTAASAGYWLASAADKIIAEPKSTIGSIGTMLSFADIQPALELQGVKFHNINSDQSPDKNSLFQQVRQGNYDQYKKEVLNPLTDDFHKAMKAFRPNIEADQMTGKTFYSENVVGTMVDQIGTIKDALAAIDEMATPQPATSVNQNHNTMQIENVNQILGTELQADTEGFISLNQEQIEALNAALAAQQEHEPTPVAQPAAQEPESAPAAADSTPDPMAAAMSEIAQLRESLERMQNAPGATTATAAPKNDPGKQGPQLATDPKADFWENVQKVKAEYLEN